MKKGDSVKVRSIWAGGCETSAAWFGGYVFEAEDNDDNCVLVKHADGTFAGLVVRYFRVQVRPDTDLSKRVEST